MRVFHVSTIGQSAIDKTYRLLRSVTDYTYTAHAESQQDTKNVAHWRYILTNGSLVELKIDESAQKAHRALLRTFDGHCAVFCPKYRKVITTWYNQPTDKHFSINPAQYERGVIKGKV